MVAKGTGVAPQAAAGGRGRGWRENGERQKEGTVAPGHAVDPRRGRTQRADSGEMSGDPPTVAPENEAKEPRFALAKGRSCQRKD